jgi:hypothetical protein
MTKRETRRRTSETRCHYLGQGRLSQIHAVCGSFGRPSQANNGSRESSLRTLSTRYVEVVLWRLRCAACPQLWRRIILLYLEDASGQGQAAVRRRSADRRLDDPLKTGERDRFAGRRGRADRIDDQPRIAHAKTMVIDGAVTLMGSYNWTTGAARNRRSEPWQCGGTFRVSTSARQAVSRARGIFGAYFFSCAATSLF